MRAHRSTRHAPLLLGALTVASTVALAAVIATDLASDQRAEREALAALPAERAAAVGAELRARFDAAVARDARRPPFHFARDILTPVADDEPLGWQASPLLFDSSRPGIAAYFGEEVFAFAPEDRGPHFFTATATAAPPSERASALAEVARQLVGEWVALDERERLLSVGRTRRDDLALADVAALVAEVGRTDAREVVGELENVRRELGAAALNERRVAILASDVRRELRPTSGGSWVVAAWWQVIVDPPAAEDPVVRRLRVTSNELRSYGLHLLQGVLYDVDWWFQRGAAAAAEAVLGPGERLCTPDGPPDGWPAAEVDLLASLGVEAPSRLPPSFGSAMVALDPTPLARRQRREWTVFAITAGALAALLGAIGCVTTRRLHRDLRRTERIGEFVAAVTHELRTPISTIALHTEMLIDGWIDDPEQRSEYYRRIDAETARLSRLVERILEQSRLTRGRAEAPGAEPEPTDLSEAIRRLVPSLEAGGPADRHDLRFDLADDLPPVLASHEAIESVVTNLVENARKYAPFDPARGADGQIVVATRAVGDSVVLEVADRGPGIPSSEQRRVFEAFYRIGTEATRTTTGTGLGLHLVQLQVSALGGRVEALERPGGGALLQVRFPAV